MKIFRKEEMQRLEKAAGEAGVTMAQLMDGAGKALAREVEKRLRPLAGRRVALLCGSGNNGGDGFVCAGYLQAGGALCTVLLLQGPPKTELSAAAFSGRSQEIELIDAAGEEEPAKAALERADCIVDCLFGFGFRGEMPHSAVRWLSHANRMECLKISADLPSGTECDSARVSLNAFRADCTVAFTAKKPAHCSYPAKEFCGEVVTAQVGVPSVLIEAAEPKLFETDGAFVQSVLPALPAQCNKGDRGRLLLVCGSYGMAGACMMAARAALRCGVGLLQLVVDKKLYPILAQAVPEAVFTVLDPEGGRRESDEKLCASLEKSSACLIGCGLGDLSELLAPAVFSHGAAPMVADADALNFLSRHPGVLEDVEAPLVLTPHPGEMARLCGDEVREIQADRLTAAQMKARETGAVVALKGAATVIAAPDGRCAVNPTGNPGMAKGGSGDVLAGVIASLLAQGVPPFEAAAAGVYLHGMAGDLAAKRLTRRAMLPTDLIEALPEVFRALQTE